MRLQSFVASLALLLAGGLNTAVAQHAGGHGSGSHGGHGGVASPAPVVSSHFGSNSAGHVTVPTPIGLQRQYAGYTGINPGVFSNSNRRREGRGYNYGYGPGYWYPPIFLSTFDDTPPVPYAGPLQAQAPEAQAADMNANELGEQVAQLSAEVEALRSEREGLAYYGAPVPQGYMGPQQPVPYAAPPAEASQEDTVAAAPITLVLPGGKQVQLKSYAVMGKYVWDFSAQPAKRIALSTVDIAASRAATEATGAEFPDIH